MRGTAWRASASRPVRRLGRAAGLRAAIVSRRSRMQAPTAALYRAVKVPRSRCRAAARRCSQGLAGLQVRRPRQARTSSGRSWRDAAAGTPSLWTRASAAARRGARGNDEAPGRRGRRRPHGRSRSRATRRSGSSPASSNGLRDGGVPVVGAEDGGHEAVARHRRGNPSSGMSSVDDIDTADRQARAGASPRRVRRSGSFGVKATARRDAAAHRACEDDGRRAADDPRRRPRRGGADRARRSRRCGDQFPDAEVIVADDGSRDATAAVRRGGRRDRPAPPAPRQGAGAVGRGAGCAAWRLLLARRRRARRP